MSDAKQNQQSQQSSDNPAGKQQQQPSSKSDTKAGIGSSQGQDREHREDGDRVPHTGQGTADIERSSVSEQGQGESLADDPVGAFKERP